MVTGQYVGNITIKEVHSWTESSCNICHPMNVAVDKESVFLKSDLCLSCHEDTVVKLASSKLRSFVQKMNDHPIKFSPYDFLDGNINKTIFQNGKNIWIQGPTGFLPLFGKTVETAVVECATCHDPHGRSGFPGLLRIENSRGDLCHVCHLDL